MQDHRKGREIGYSAWQCYWSHPGANLPLQLSHRSFHPLCDGLNWSITRGPNNITAGTSRKAPTFLPAYLGYALLQSALLHPPATFHPLPAPVQNILQQASWQLLSPLKRLQPSHRETALWNFCDSTCQQNTCSTVTTIEQNWATSNEHTKGRV